MSRLRPEKLHVRFAGEATPLGVALPRRYALTHSDRTGDLFLTIGTDYDYAQISGWHTRLMRDEVLAEWQDEEGGAVLHVHCHVSGGLALGPSRMRFAIFQRELPLVLEAIRHGDRQLFENLPHLDGAPVLVHFHAREPRYPRVERWRTPADFDIFTDSPMASSAEPAVQSSGDGRRRAPVPPKGVFPHRSGSPLPCHHRLTAPQHGPIPDRVVQYVHDVIVSQR